MRLRTVKDHAVDLAREVAMEHLRAAQELTEEQDDFGAARRKKKGSRLLYRLAPGKSDSIGAVIDDRGRYLTEPQAMADFLRGHWSEVFRARGVDQSRLQTWLDDDAVERGSAAPTHEALRQLRVRRRDVRKALKKSNNSAPGPDGIPYGAWRALGKVAVEALFGALGILMEDDGPACLLRDYPDFNGSLLFFLPKKAAGTTPDGTQAFEAGGVRPLNVTNCDNRLLASTIRLVLEPIIGPLITKDQRGFLTGRSMLANVLDIEEAMICTARESEQGWAFFYDMAAAFPSVEQEFFHGYFHKLGWPRWLLNIIHIFYLNNTCQICLAGARYIGFTLTRGIRQGCPLSPLLFAMATDLMLRRLQRLFPGATSRAWADDLAMVLPAAASQLRALQNFFLDFGCVAGLHLNMSKTVIVPLHRYNMGEVRTCIAHNAPDWGGVTVAGAAKYLGFYVGPDRGTLSWEDPLKKFLNRAKMWGKMGIGMLLTLQSYRVYISSVLQFVAQLEPLPENFNIMERKAVQSLFPGPTAWILPSALKDAKYLHLPIALVDMHAIATAAKVRVLRCENQAEGGLRISSRADKLLQYFGDDCSLGHSLWCENWGRKSFFFSLRDADSEVRCKLRSCPGTDLMLHKRLGLQKRVSDFCRSTCFGDAGHHLRRRLDRWSMETLPGHRVQRAVRVLGTLQRHATPRVQAGYLRAICDGWCTRRRFQGRGDCLFGCGGGDDGLQHIASCAVVSELFCNGIHLPSIRGSGALDCLFCMNTTDEEVIVARCAGLYALYRTYNGLRHHAFSHTELQDAYNRYLREALR